MGRRERRGGGRGGASINHREASAPFPGRRMQGEAPGLLPRRGYVAQLELAGAGKTRE